MSLGRAMRSSIEVGLRVVFLMFGALVGVGVGVRGCVLGEPVPTPALGFPGGILVLYTCKDLSRRCFLMILFFFRGNRSLEESPLGALSSMGVQGSFLGCHLVSD